jgi:hypothetical protein
MESNYMRTIFKMIDKIVEMVSFGDQQLEPLAKFDAEVVRHKDWLSIAPIGVSKIFELK